MVNNGDLFQLRDIKNTNWLHVDMTSGQNETKGGYIHDSCTTYRFNNDCL